jgi:glycosyltransferase involved in cell wall biosynthesis
MRILLISGSYPPEMCGVGDYTLHLACALAKQSNCIGILTHQTLQISDTAVTQVHFAGGWQWWRLFSILANLRSWHPDIVHLQYPSLGYPRRVAPILLTLYLRFMRVRLIITLHEPLRWLSLPWFLTFCMCANALVLVRHNYFELIPRLYSWMLKRKLHRLILNASPLPTSTLSNSQKVSLKNELLTDRKRLVVYFGFIFPQKGIEILLDIIDPDHDRLLLIGANPDAMYQSQLQLLIDSSGLSDAVVITGMLPADQVADMIACCDAVVLPFLKGAGSWNTTVHASQAQGTAVITTTTSVPQELPEQNIFYASVNDREEMRRLLNKYSGVKIKPISPNDEWTKIANDHSLMYHQIS